MKKINLKSILAMLLLITTMTTLIACVQDPNGNGKDTSEGSGTESGTETTPVEEALVLAENGETEYKAVRSEFITDSFLEEYKSFVNDIRDDIGVRFVMSDDFYRRDLDPAEFTEILFGPANREESRQVYSEIGYDGYAVKRVGNKVVIAAYTAEKLYEAAKAFINDCIKVEKTDETNIKITYVQDVIEKGSTELFFTDANKISDYVVIYAPDAEDAAKSFVKAVEKYNGIELTYKPDTEAAVEKEILIGNTNRTESTKNKIESKIGFIFAVEGTKLVINALNQANLSGAVDYVRDSYMRTAVTMNIPKNLFIENIPYVGTESAMLHDDADIRVMSFNILSEEWTAEAVMEPRIVGVVGTILYYMPDVIGVQEVSTQWYKVLREYLADDYVFINSDILGSSNNNYTALAYNKNTVKLIASDFYQYSVYNSKRLRSINFGLFETLEGGNRFAVTNTHFNANHGGDNTPQRETQAKEFVAKIKEYSTKYSCPIIMTGDYNVAETASPYKIIVADGTIQETKYTAKTKGTICRTYHNLGELPPDTVNSIDHIFYTGDIEPLYYTTLSDEVLKITSDHCPIFCDFKFKK